MPISNPNTFDPPAVNIKLGAAGTVLTSNGDSEATPPTFQAAAGGGPGGSDGQVQYNHAGAFGGTDALYYDPTNPAVVTIGSATNTFPILSLDTNVLNLSIRGPLQTFPNNDGAGSQTIAASSIIDGATFIGGGYFDSYSGSIAIPSGFVVGGGNATSLGSGIIPTTGTPFGTVSIAGGINLDQSGNLLGGLVNINTAPAQTDAPIEVTILDGGSGYTDGVYTDFSQLQDIELDGLTTQYAAAASLTISGGTVTAVSGLYASTGPASLGDVLTLFLYPPVYSGAIPSVPATFAVSELGSSNGDGYATVNNFIVYPNGAVVVNGSDNSGAGFLGQVFTSAGGSGPPTWSDPSTPIVSRNTIVSAGNLTIADGVTLESLRAAGTLAAFTVTMSATPQDEQQMAIVCNHTITAFTLSPNAGQTLENAPTTLLAGQQVIFLYDLATTTWERLQ